MSGGEYAPKDSRDVTLHENAPGKPSGWREDEDGGDSDLAPADSRKVHGTAGKAAQPPAGVPQADAPFTADEAAAPVRPEDRAG